MALDKPDFVQAYIWQVPKLKAYILTCWLSIKQIAFKQYISYISQKKKVLGPKEIIWQQ